MIFKNHVCNLPLLPRTMSHVLIGGCDF
jgi:hypothetical protein